VRREMADTLQRSLLPGDVPAVDRLAVTARYLPAVRGTSAGGDWYDVLPLAGGAVAVAVGDVVGNGAPAAAVMGQLRSVLSTALMTGSSPAQALEVLDRFASRLPGATASTAACLVVDVTHGTVRWARAGHPPPLLLDDGEATYLDSAGSGTVLGVAGRRPFTEGTTTVSPGAVILLYTDGLVERRNASIDAGLDRLADEVQRHGGQPPESLATLLLREMLADTDQPDDVALIAARLMPAPLAGRIAADPTRLATVRRAVFAWADAAALPEDSVEDLQLALGEALANAVEHAYRDQKPGQCAYALTWSPDGGVDVSVEDFGVWREVPADPGFRGRGLMLMRELADDVSVEQSPGGGTSVRFRVPVRLGATEDGDGQRRSDADNTGTGAEITHGPDGGLVLSGELDLASAAAVRPHLLAAVDAEAPRDLTLDLRDLSYLASAGLGLLLELADRARQGGGRLWVLVDPEGSPARVLELAGLETLVAGTR
jgi:anti-anti-sigma factor